MLGKSNQLDIGMGIQGKIYSKRKKNYIRIQPIDKLQYSNRTVVLTTWLHTTEMVWGLTGEMKSFLVGCSSSRRAGGKSCAAASRLHSQPSTQRYWLRIQNGRTKVCANISNRHAEIEWLMTPRRSEMMMRYKHVPQVPAALYTYRSTCARSAWVSI